MSEGVQKRERQIKRTIDCKRGDGIGNEGKKIEGRDVIDGQRKRGLQSREMEW